MAFEGSFKYQSKFSWVDFAKDVIKKFSLSYFFLK